MDSYAIQTDRMLSTRMAVERIPISKVDLTSLELNSSSLDDFLDFGLNRIGPCNFNLLIEVSKSMRRVADWCASNWLIQIVEMFKCIGFEYRVAVAARVNCLIQSSFHLWNDTPILDVSTYRASRCYFVACSQWNRLKMEEWLGRLGAVFDGL